MDDISRRTLMQTSVAAALGASVTGKVAAEAGPGAPAVEGSLTRIATTALGAEVTGPFVSDDGTVFMNLQHPSRDNPQPYDKGGIGYFDGLTLDGSSDPAELGAPDGQSAREKIQVSSGGWTPLAQEGDSIDGATETLGVPRTPDGTDIDTLAGSRYAELGFTPDMNELIEADDSDEYDYYLFTNFETSPGSITRLPLTQADDGSWSASLDDAINVENTQAFRDIGGTRINCWGDLSPWDTVISAEEDYSHTRGSYGATVSDIVEDGGTGKRGASDFWNRPDPTWIGSNNWGSMYNDGAYPQGTWALGGVELLAYYLGAQQVDQQSGNDNNDIEPISDDFPNKYRYGYFVELRAPTADTPTPVKHYVMGRAAWEAPDIQADERTVYGTSDGTNKGLYKFVADDPIPDYDDPMNVSGTLHAATVTNEDAAKGSDPGEVNLELEWTELGNATNSEVESWIAEYDDVSQVDYLEEHASTDWREDLPTALDEADREVVANGNRSYISDQEILDWADQYESDGPGGVDEDLRRVPFLETRAAATEIGATTEFRKSEGIDSVDGAGPGDYVYVGISEVNDGMSDDAGDIQVSQVDGGMVYRGELESDYNVSTLEPMIVGPNASDPADVADDALLNVDNVYALDDGRLLCCEDADQLGRSYKNDGMWLYDPTA